MLCKKATIRDDFECSFPQWARAIVCYCKDTQLNSSAIREETKDFSSDDTNDGTCIALEYRWPLCLSSNNYRCSCLYGATLSISTLCTYQDKEAGGRHSIHHEGCTCKCLHCVNSPGNHLSVH